MISVMVSKWVADAFGKEGIYSVWIAMRQYPWVPPTEFHDRGETAAQVMKSAQNIVVIRDDGSGCTLQELDQLLRTHRFHGFPVLREDQLLGYVTRDALWSALGELRPLIHDRGAKVSQSRYSLKIRHQACAESALSPRGWPVQMESS